MTVPKRKADSTRSANSANGQQNATGPRPGYVVITVNGVQVEVSAKLQEAVNRAIQAARQPLPPEMTTTQAAEFLGVSRPFIIKLIDRGELPCRKVGKHRRIPSQALRDYREKWFRRAMAAADEITRASQELGLYDEPPRKMP